MIAIDKTIENVERFYKSLTGNEAPQADTVYAPIPAERDPSEHVEEQLDRLLGLLESQSTAAGFAAAGEAPVPLRTPFVTVWESEHEFLLAVELPGVGREQVEVVVQGNLLVVTGKRVEMKDPEMTLRATEIPLGSFRRSVALPPGVKKSDPRAQMRDGVLEIRIAKEEKEAVEARPIPVN